MDFSIVIPVLNEENRLRKCLEHLIALNYPQDKYEIIVVDNGSTDRSVEIAKSFGIKVIHEPRKGITFARQMGLEIANGKYYATLDADTLAPPDWLRTVKGEFSKDPNIVGLSGPDLFYDVPKWKQKPLLHISYLMLKIPNVLVGNNMIIKRDAALKAGGFTLGKHKYFEDMIITKRLKKIGKIKVSRKLVMNASFRRYNTGAMKTQFIIIFRHLYFQLFGTIYKDDLPHADFDQQPKSFVKWAQRAR